MNNGRVAVMTDNKLRKLAEAAQSGKHTPHYIYEERVPGCPGCERDDKWLGLCDTMTPDQVLRLLDRIKALRQGIQAALDSPYIMGESDIDLLTCALEADDAAQKNYACEPTRKR